MKKVDKYDKRKFEVKYKVGDLEYISYKKNRLDDTDMNKIYINNAGEIYEIIGNPAFLFDIYDRYRKIEDSSGVTAFMNELHRLYNTAETEYEKAVQEVIDFFTGANNADELVDEFYEFMESSFGEKADTMIEDLVKYTRNTINPKLNDKLTEESILQTIYSSIREKKTEDSIYNLKDYLKEMKSVTNHDHNLMQVSNYESIIEIEKVYPEFYDIIMDFKDNTSRFVVYDNEVIKWIDDTPKYLSIKGDHKTYTDAFISYYNSVNSIAESGEGKSYYIISYLIKG